MSGRGPVLLRGALPAAMAPGRANGLNVVVVGEGVCWVNVVVVVVVYALASGGARGSRHDPQIRLPQEVIKE